MPMEMTHSGQNNLLVALHGYAHQQDENFTTEAFAHLLRHLLKHDARVAANALNYLAGDCLRLDGETCAEVGVVTQQRTRDGQPDIEILLRGKLRAIVEVKVVAPVSTKQIAAYKRILKKESGRARTCLVLLTRFAPDLQAGDEKPYCVRWFKMAERLAEADKGLKEKTSKYLCQQFLGFMRERGLTMEHVGKELVPGIQAISSFRAMLERALDELDIRKLKRSSWVEAVGCHFHIGRRFFWVGIDYSELSKLQLSEFRVASGKWRWVRDGGSRDLAEEAFFDLPKQDQINWLRSFIKKETAGGKRPRA